MFAKKVINSVTLFLLLTTIMNGQYTPFVEEGKYWIYLNYSQSNADFPEPISGHAITILGDTIVNAVSYKKVYKLNLKGEHDCLVTEMPCWDFYYPYQSESKELVSLVREDTIAKQTYAFLESAENLLFDFSLGLGDTLNADIYDAILASETIQFPGGIVDSIKVIDLYSRPRRTIFTFGYYNIIGLPFETVFGIAEGVGYTEHGIFYEPFSAFIDYCEVDIEQCDLILSNKSTEPHKEIKIYPNPSNGIFQIESEERLINIKVYSVLGQLVAKVKSTKEIDLSNLENGIYILVISTDHDRDVIKRIVKERSK